jgi:hypothetical protein
MTRIVGMIAIAAAVVLSAIVFAPRTPRSDAAEAASAARLTVASSGPTLLTTSGTITAFDPASAMLTLSTSRGEERFALRDPGLRVREGLQAIDVEQLSSLTGHDVHLEYTETGGRRTVTFVHVQDTPKVSEAGR